ncbi:MAG: exosortase/archaeosortase family protein [Candidatus Diapherotrites archaeon]|uniref:Exosortase/archaeosortase family protein n=1 Tax=Candidatus Iainarchaeum sp. TaxID=3101447 RepID=A0A7J4JVL7_9ARCH|nr:exosortase/archaeosortase family protein [Candidatus Diapherotrites archaeon]HIH21822.1 exosortase/archaeosortase family protein [Candidatus Diapherotrites archaeon]HIH33306.1 exosortase/archaeosortase family protein [Candidatus Diapherotrites archaeon]
MSKSKKQKFGSNGKKEALKGLKFLAAWLLAFAVLYYGAIAVFGWNGIEGFTAAGAEKILNSFTPSKTSVDFNAEPVVLNVEGKQILISELCTGLLETALLAAAIIASIGIEWRKRIFGAIAAIAFGMAFNQLRIFASIMQILNTDLEFAELTHDLFFRLSLLIVIAGFYYLWFRKAAKGRLTKTRED